MLAAPLATPEQVKAIVGDIRTSKTTADQWARTWSRDFRARLVSVLGPAGVPPESPSSDSTSAPASGAATE